MILIEEMRYNGGETEYVVHCKDYPDIQGLGPTKELARKDFDEKVEAFERAYSKAEEMVDKSMRIAQLETENRLLNDAVETLQKLNEDLSWRLEKQAALHEQEKRELKRIVASFTKPKSKDFTVDVKVKKLPHDEGIAFDCSNIRLFIDYVDSVVTVDIYNPATGLYECVDAYRFGSRYGGKGGIKTMLNTLIDRMYINAEIRDKIIEALKYYEIDVEGVNG